MKLRSSADKRAQEPVTAKRVCVWVGRLALLIFGLLGPFAPNAKAYQGLKDVPFTVSVADPEGAAMPDVLVDLVRDGKLLARMKTEADGRA